MSLYNADLHFHSPYAGGVSKNMSIPVISEQARLKGLQVVSSADITHGKWREEVKKHLVEDSNGVYREPEHGTYFIIGTEVEDCNRVHHLLFFPDIERAEQFREKLEGKANFDAWGCGRPRIRENAEKIAQVAEECNALMGPAHAFTPYFSVYAHFDSVAACYGGMATHVRFIELGLSADNGLADLISANHGFQFLTCSDSHSPWPHRIGREFVQMQMAKADFKSLEKVLTRTGEGKIARNIGLNPLEGKYHKTACNGCYAQFESTQAAAFSWRCPQCRGSIKKGVRDRIMELKDTDAGKNARNRAPYTHLLPLAEIIQLSMNIKNVQAQKVQSAWFDLVHAFGNEIRVLLSVEEEELKSFNPEVGEMIAAFRNGWVLFRAGGGGKYGTPIVCRSKTEWETRKKELRKEQREQDRLWHQKSLAQF